MSSTYFSPAGSYTPLLDPRETEQAIKLVRDFFHLGLAEALNLKRVTAPLFVPAGSGINDDLNGVEQPVRFAVKGLGGAEVEIVQSLAKWKRLTLAELGVYPGEGIYADMNAVRPDETLDELHSVYVDQWDWERTILPEDRQVEFLKGMVRKIYRVLRRSERAVADRYPEIAPQLPAELTFVHAEGLEARWPELTPREREDAIACECGAVFIIGIGAPLRSGEPHDGRAPDYDDWITPNGAGCGLNGDLIVYYPLLDRGFELSSMGIRVSPETLREQLARRGQQERERLYFHHRLLAGELPLSIGGGIGQSRLCMLLLRKAHIGEVQVGVWPEAMLQTCRDRGIPLL
ncbi:MAG: aspartate--ammonia ligase [Acidobacteriota bacterium]